MLIRVFDQNAGRLNACEETVARWVGRYEDVDAEDDDDEDEDEEEPEDAENGREESRGER